MEAVRVYEQVLGRLGHPNLIDTYANLGSLLTKTGNFASAKDYLCKALGLNQQLRGAGPHAGRQRSREPRPPLLRRPATTRRRASSSSKALEIYMANVKRKRLPRKHPYIARSADLAEAGRMLSENADEKRRRRSRDGRRNALTGEPIARIDPRRERPASAIRPKGRAVTPGLTALHQRAIAARLSAGRTMARDRYRDYNRVCRG